MIVVEDLASLQAYKLASLRKKITAWNYW